MTTLYGKLKTAFRFWKFKINSVFIVGRKTSTLVLHHWAITQSAKGRLLLNSTAEFSVCGATDKHKVTCVHYYSPSQLLLCQPVLLLCFSRYRYLTGMVDKRTLEKYEREAKEKNRETWWEILNQLNSIKYAHECYQ